MRKKRFFGKMGLVDWLCRHLFLNTDKVMRNHKIWIFRNLAGI